VRRPGQVAGDLRHLGRWSHRWPRILPHPFTGEDIAAGHSYEVSISQAEFSLTQMLDKPVSGRIFFDQIIADNLEIGRPDQVSLVFGRQAVPELSGASGRGADLGKW
jgi:hypothetical protein